MAEQTDINQTNKIALTKLQQDAPIAMTYFSQLANSAIEAGAIDVKTKVLITLSIAIHWRSEACIKYHVEQAYKHGIRHEEIQELITIAAYMGGGPALMAAEYALELYETLAQ